MQSNKALVSIFSNILKILKLVFLIFQLRLTELYNRNTSEKLKLTIKIRGGASIVISDAMGSKAKKFERTERLDCQKCIRLQLISPLFKFNKRNALSVRAFFNIYTGGAKAPPPQPLSPK